MLCYSRIWVCFTPARNQSKAKFSLPDRGFGPTPMLPSPKHGETHPKDFKYDDLKDEGRSLMKQKSMIALRLALLLLTVVGSGAMPQAPIPQAQAAVPVRTDPQAAGLLHPRHFWPINPHTGEIPTEARPRAGFFVLPGCSQALPALML